MPRVPSGSATTPAPDPAAPASSNGLPGVYGNPAMLLFTAATFAAASYGLMEMGLYEALIHHDTKVNHTALTISLMSTLVLVAVKVYMENLRPTRDSKDKLVYENYKSLTHAALVLILISCMGFNVAILPRFGFAKTCLISLMVGYGVVFNFLVLVPWNWVQNLVGVVGGTWFLQLYAGVGSGVGSAV